MKKITLSSMLFFAMIVANTNAYSQDQLLMDCEDGTTGTLTLNVFANGAGESNADVTIVDNPSVSGINTSAKVAQFLRRTGGGAASYTGAYSGGQVVDFTTNKYVHVKVLKTKVSPVKFKIQGGPDGDREIASTEPYATADVWQDMVFLITESGVYPTVVFFPDFEDPLVDTGDIMVYFDDIVINNIATPTTLGLNSNTTKSKIALYPSAVKNELNINAVSKISSLSIYNMQGKKVYEGKNLAAGTNQVNMSSYSKGMYVVKMVTENGEKISQKIVKN